MTRSNEQEREMVERLLGPNSYEVGCDECFELLDEFVELELAGGEVEERMPGLRAHLEGCSVCRGEHEALRALVSADDHERSER